MNKLARFVSYGICTSACLFSTISYATLLDVTVNTSMLSGQTGEIYFDLVSGGSGVANTGTITGFNTDGTLNGLGIPSGSVSGLLIPGPVTLDTSSFFNEWAQNITFGTNFSFYINLTNIGAGASNTPDAFSLFVQDGSGNLVPTTDGTFANSLLLFNIDGTTNGNLNVYADTVGLNPVTWTAGIPAVGGGTPTGPATVPEPSALWLIAIGIIGLWTNRKNISAA